MYDKGLWPATLAVCSLAFNVIARRDAFADTNPQLMSGMAQRGAVAASGSWIVDLDCTCESVDEQACRMRAAEYVRMSTEHQQYSTENQRDRIRD